LLVALVGLAITDTWGWVGQQWQPIPGESRALGQGTPYVLRLDAFEVQVDDGRALCDCSSQVTWFEGTAELGSDLVRVGWPASRSGVAVRQIGFVPVIRMRGWDDEGRPLTLETDADALSVTGVAEIRFTSPESQPLVLVTGHDLFLSLSFEPNCGIGKPELYLSRIETGGTSQSMIGTLRESGTVFVDDLRLDIDLSFVPILRSDFQPGRGAVVAGLTLAIIAGLSLWLAPPRLIWIREGEREAQGKTVRVIALAPAGPSAWWHRLVSECQKVSSDDA
jgi:hypothetical protein